MASVNDLRDDLPENDLTGYWLRQITRDAWHPVSEPPTEADGDNDGYVLFYGRWIGVHTEQYNHQGRTRFDNWARVRDVVLMPEGDDGTS